MAREDVERHIEEQLAEYDGTRPETEDTDNDGEDVEVALQELVCTECGTTNGREPRPVSVPDVGNQCDNCDDFTIHEYVRED